MKLTRYSAVALLVLACCLCRSAVPGEPALLERAGRGALYAVDGHRVAVLAGTPEQMGRQHGTLLRRDVRALMDRVKAYGESEGAGPGGLGLSASLEYVWQRAREFTPDRYVKEIDALADAAELPRARVRRINVLPELFHCSGFALRGKATADGTLLHGRVLDYATDAGLQQHAVTFVCLPEGRNAFVNVGYAGFIGSVTGMNERKVAFGEMGGGGVGEWDGMPMSFLMRVGLEEAGTLEEALEIFRTTPRTCEYYYVISDGKSRAARGLRCTPDEFQTVDYGEPHPLLPRPVPDTILLSADERYRELVRRVKESYGGIDPAGARRIMTRPVAMRSNLHCVLFAPEQLTLWVAHAADPESDPDFQACNQPYIRLNLGAWLERAARLGDVN